MDGSTKLRQAFRSRSAGFTDILMTAAKALAATALLAGAMQDVQAQPLDVTQEQRVAAVKARLTQHMQDREAREADERAARVEAQRKDDEALVLYVKTEAENLMLDADSRNDMDEAVAWMERAEFADDMLGDEGRLEGPLGVYPADDQDEQVALAFRKHREMIMEMVVATGTREVRSIFLRMKETIDGRRRALGHAPDAPQHPADSDFAESLLIGH